MARRYFVDLRVVEGAVVAVDLDDPVLNAARKRLQILRRLHRLVEMVNRVERLDRFARHRLAVDDEPTVGDLDLVAGETDQPLDVVGLAIARQLEHDDVASLGIGGEKAARHRLGGKVEKARQREMRIAVGVFGDEQIVADEQGRHQRTRGNIEGLEQDRAHHERDQERLDDDFDGFPPALLLLDGRDGGVGGFYGRFDHSGQYALPRFIHAALDAARPRLLYKGGHLAPSSGW